MLFASVNTEFKNTNTQFQRSHELGRETVILMGNYNKSCGRVKLRKLWIWRRNVNLAWKNQERLPGGNDL